MNLVGRSGVGRVAYPCRVPGGYKATLKNPNVSDEAKEHAEKVLEEMDAK